MMKRWFVHVLLIAPMLLMTAEVRASALDDLLADYKQQGAGPEFSAENGEALWRSSRGMGPEEYELTCTACHTTDLTQPGTHKVTGKPIAPMAPSVQKERLTDAEKIEKWFRRNCREVLGRACTPQEKGDILMFLSKQ